VSLASLREFSYDFSSFAIRVFSKFIVIIIFGVYNCFTNLLPGTCPAVVKTQTHPQPEHDSARPRPSTSPQRTAQPKIASKMSAHKRKAVKSLRKKLKTQRETTSLNGFNGFWLLKR
jgi:ABC-type nickel/cobalt efflux system permease component RcnA